MLRRDAVDISVIGTRIKLKSTVFPYTVWVTAAHLLSDD